MGSRAPNRIGFYCKWLDAVSVQPPHSRIQKFAEQLKRNPVEREFTRFLSRVDGGKFRDTFMYLG